jgi:hypothetical protein
VKSFTKEQSGKVITKQIAPAKPFATQTKNSLSKSRPALLKNANRACRKGRVCIFDVAVQAEENKINQENINGYTKTLS